jgi:hypothetical protein
MTASGGTAIVLWTAAKREASLPKRTPAEEQVKEKRRQDERVDEQRAESFPASDPPSYAGGAHSVGGPRRPKSRKSEG